jgi:hypothetical protein
MNALRPFCCSIKSSENCFTESNKSVLILAGGPKFRQGRPQFLARPSEPFQQFDTIIEMRDKSQIAIRTQHPVEKRITRAPLRFENVHLVLAGVDQQTESQREIGFTREITDRLRAPILFEREIPLVEVFDDCTIPIAHRDQQRDHFYIRRKRRILRPSEGREQ